ncbi:MAG TPA: hypothetical protein VFM54_02375 [Micromonosporaceae bacterium]|nr:hypothetical protein [Micromonosporaceae bacterium]
MTITIGDDRMTSDVTPHFAQLVAAGGPCRCSTRWRVSWLPGRTLSRDEATTAMTLAELVARGVRDGDRRWPFVVGWAQELGLSGAQAAQRVRETPPGSADEDPARGDHGRGA